MDVNNVKQQLLDGYAECLESQGEDAAKTWLHNQFETLYEKVISKADPMEEVQAFSVLMELAFPLEGAKCQTV
jgi:hypothetical protein